MRGWISTVLFQTAEMAVGARIKAAGMHSAAGSPTATSVTMSVVALI